MLWSSSQICQHLFLHSIEILCLGYEVYTKNRKCALGRQNLVYQTGHENRVDYRPRNYSNIDIISNILNSLTYLECAELCISFGDCHFFFYNTNLFCDLFEKCTGKYAPGNKTTKHNGFLYQKISTGKRGWYDLYKVNSCWN